MPVGVDRCPVVLAEHGSRTNVESPKIEYFKPSVYRCEKTYY